MKTIIIIPDGVGIRNFLCTRFIDHLLEAGGDVVVWHALADELLAPYRERFGDRLAWVGLPPYRESPPERILRQAKIFAQLYWHRKADPCAGIPLTRIKPARRLVDRGIQQAARLLGCLSGSGTGAARLDRWHAQAVRRARRTFAAHEFLREQRADIVFCTHQRASRAVPAMLAARELGTPTATFIYSWDNLPKGRMAVHADHYLVWSDGMKAEMARYYPEVSADRVHVTGTPQFEHYFNPDLFEPRDAFFRRHQLDLARPVVCFSGDDVSTSPDDPQYLADLAEALRSWPEPARQSAERGARSAEYGNQRSDVNAQESMLQAPRSALPAPCSACSRPQILFRRCPVDVSGRYAPVLERYPEIRVSEPLWQAAPGDWTQIVPTMEDIALLANIAKHCDAVVNLGSTMAMDFAIFDKPGIFLAYDPVGGKPNVNGVYRLPHFQTVHRCDPVWWVRNLDDLTPTVMDALSHPQRHQNGRRKWLDTIAMGPLDQASRRCALALKSLHRYGHDHGLAGSPSRVRSESSA